MANSEHVKKIKNGVSEWNSWRDTDSHATPDLGWASLNGLELEAINLGESILKLAFFKGSNLRNADFSDSVLYGTNFENSNLESANLENADLEGAHLINSNLTNANLSRSNLKLANFDGAVLDGADFSNVRKLKAEQLKRVQSIKNARLDASILDELRSTAPHLFKE